MTIPVVRNMLPQNADVHSMSRDEQTQYAMSLLQYALFSAHEELSTLLGNEIADEQIQNYLLHQMEALQNRRSSN